jgi:hypothetical protein
MAWERANKEWIGMDLEASSRSHSSDNIPVFFWRRWAKISNILSQDSLQAGLELDTIRTRNRRINAVLTRSASILAFSIPLPFPILDCLSLLLFLQYFLLLSSVSIVTGLRAGRPGVDSQQRQGFFLFVTVSGPALVPNQPPLQWVPWTLSPDIKRPEREDDLPPSCNAEDKNARSYSSNPPYIFMAWCLIKHRIRLHGVLLS